MVDVDDCVLHSIAALQHCACFNVLRVLTPRHVIPVCVLYRLLYRLFHPFHPLCSCVPVLLHRSSLRCFASALAGLLRGRGDCLTGKTVQGELWAVRVMARHSLVESTLHSFTAIVYQP